MYFLLLKFGLAACQCMYVFVDYLFLSITDSKLKEQLDIKINNCVTFMSFNSFHLSSCVCLCFLSYWICILSGRDDVSVCISYCLWWNVCVKVSVGFLGGCKHFSLSSLCVFISLNSTCTVSLMPLVFVSSAPIFQMTVTWKRSVCDAFKLDVGWMCECLCCLFEWSYTGAFVKPRMCVCVCARAASLSSDSSSLQSEN